MANILASGIKNVPHLRQIDQVGETRLGEIDLTRLLVYMVDTIPADVLPLLAEQFDMLGYKGWRFVTYNKITVPPETVVGTFAQRVTDDSGTIEAQDCLFDFVVSLESYDAEEPDPDALEAQQRDLIKSAIELHRYKGTPWSIKEALRRVGFGGAEIIEGVGRYRNGTFFRNGTVTYSGEGNWANFRVIFDLGNAKGINAQQTADLLALIDEYKNARSKLVDLAWRKSIEDSVTMAEEISFVLTIPNPDETFVPYHDGRHRRNGTIQYAAYSEQVPINQQT